MKEELIVGFTPVRAAARVARWHGKLRTQLILLACAAAVTVAVLIWRHGQLPLLTQLLLFCLLAIPAVLAIVDAVMFSIARRDLDTVGEGPALVVARDGVTVRGHGIAWPGVRRVFTRPGGVLRSSLLVVEHDGAPLTLPLDFVDRPLPEIDRAIRQASSGRTAVEISPLEVVQRP